MSESLTSRVGRIVSGGFHAVVDAVENLAPEAVMEQAIREIDSAVDEVRAELGREVANKHLASKRILEENRKHEELSGQLEVALAEEREDLAEAAISKQLDIEAQIPVLEQSLSERSAREKELEGYVLALQAKRREMQDELAAYKKSKEEAAAIAAGAPLTSSSGSVANSVTEADAAFQRVMQQRTGLHASGKNIDGANASKLAELEDLARKNRIKERLAQAKAKMS